MNMSKVGTSGNNPAQNTRRGGSSTSPSSPIRQGAARLVATNDNPLDQTPQETRISERFREIMENFLKEQDQTFRDDMKAKALTGFNEKYFSNPIEIEEKIKKSNNDSTLPTDCLQSYENLLPAAYRSELKEIEKYINASEQAKSNIDLFKRYLEEDLKDNSQDPEEALKNNITLCKDSIKHTFSAITKGKQIQMSEETSKAAKKRYGEIKKRINTFLAAYKKI